MQSPHIGATVWLTKLIEWQRCCCNNKSAVSPMRGLPRSGSNFVPSQLSSPTHVQDPSVVVEEHCELQSKENMLFAATAVANGSGVAVVNSIGMATEIGKIQSQIQAAAKEEDDTPLKKKLDEFGEALAKVRIRNLRRCVWFVKQS